MVQSIITFIITSLLSAISGYLVSLVKNYKKREIAREDEIRIREENQKTTLQALLRNAITTKYYIYIQIGSIPTWERENSLHLFEEYKKQGGNSYVEMIMNELLSLPIDDSLHGYSRLTSEE